jgi:hypothetical protein
MNDRILHSMMTRWCMPLQQVGMRTVRITVTVVNLTDKCGYGEPVSVPYSWMLQAFTVRYGLHYGRITAYGEDL